VGRCPGATLGVAGEEGVAEGVRLPTALHPPLQRRRRARGGGYGACPMGGRHPGGGGGVPQPGPGRRSWLARVYHTRNVPYAPARWGFKAAKNRFGGFGSNMCRDMQPAHVAGKDGEGG